MSCPIDQFGRPACLIVDHPDRNEKFCVHCKQRFVEKSFYEWLWVLIIVFIVLVLLLNGCENQANKLLLCLTESRTSSVKKTERSPLEKSACYGITDSAKLGEK